jgi:nicotinate-nucleotide pyrophosphorylase (carboxylating)
MVFWQDVDIAQKIFSFVETENLFNAFKKDGDVMHNRETAFEVKAHIHTILKCERLVLKLYAKNERYCNIDAFLYRKIKRV